MKLDLTILIAAVFVVAGVYILLRNNGGDNGGQDTPSVVPSNRFPGGGYSPGFVSTQVRNGGVGGMQPNVYFN